MRNVTEAKPDQPSKGEASQDTTTAHDRQSKNIPRFAGFGPYEPTTMPTPIAPTPNLSSSAEEIAKNVDRSPPLPAQNNVSQTWDSNQTVDNSPEVLKKPKKNRKKQDASYSGKLGGSGPLGDVGVSGINMKEH